ncbi:hypothetical protein QL285_079528 [Trifolium repens]|nr:hypothetical protein QL285_079528 [Trifolium repens]
MFSKLVWLIQGLLVMVVLISSMGEARKLVEVATKPNNVDGASSDCFIPHIPPHIPPSRHNVDVAPSTPKTLNAEYESSKSTTISPCLHLE